MKFKIKILISIILACFFTAYNLIPVFAATETREGTVNINAYVAPITIPIHPKPPIVGLGGEYPDFPGEKPKEPKESELPIAIKINNDNSYTNSANVILSLAAKYAIQAAVSNNRDFQNASWENFGGAGYEKDEAGFERIEKPWKLVDGDPEAPYGRVRTVYAKFRSEAGAESEIVFDSIILDIAAPSNVSGFTASKNKNEDISLLWNNPTEKDFSKVKIFRSEKFYPMEPIAGGELSAELIYEGNGDSVSIMEAESPRGTRYYYAIFAFDLAGNNSSGAIASYGEEGEISETPETPEYPSHLPPPKIVYKLKLSDISFFANGKEIFFDENGQITFFAGDKIRISISAEKFPKDLKTIFAAISGAGKDGSSYSSSYILKINSLKTAYEADITVPQNLGDYTFSLAIMNFKEGTLENLAGKVLAVENNEYSESAAPQSGLENFYGYSKKNFGLLGIFAIFSFAVLILIGFITRKVYKIAGRCRTP